MSWVDALIYAEEVRMSYPLIALRLRSRLVSLLNHIFVLSGEGPVVKLCVLHR